MIDIPVVPIFLPWKILVSDPAKRRRRARQAADKIKSSYAAAQYDMDTGLIVHRTLWDGVI